MAKKQKLILDFEKLKSNDFCEWRYLKNNFKSILLSKESKYPFDEDVFQETLIVFFEKLNSDAMVETNTVNFLFAIYRNKLGTDTYKKTKFAKRQTVSDEQEGFRDLMPEDIGDPESIDWIDKEYIKSKMEDIKAILKKEQAKKLRKVNVNWYDFIIEYTDGSTSLGEMGEKYNTSLQNLQWLKERIETTLNSKPISKGFKNNPRTKTKYYYAYKRKSKEEKK
jgi:hypothetical protein